MDTLKARMVWTDFFQIIKDCRRQYRQIYPVNLSITIDRENKIFHDKVKFKQKVFQKPSALDGTRRKNPMKGS